MQHRMKEFSMTREAVERLLHRAQVGRFSTIGEDGYPYTVAVHFVYMDGRIYFHGLPRGRKLDNIARCPKVCFEADEMTALMLENLEHPCKADTEYESAFAAGTAGLIDGAREKEVILREIIKKYAPQLIGMEMPENMIGGTAVVKMEIERMTGKYHR